MTLKLLANVCCILLCGVHNIGLIIDVINMYSYNNLLDNNKYKFVYITLYKERTRINEKKGVLLYSLK